MRLHQRIGEHRYSAIGKHLETQHGNNRRKIDHLFKVLRKCKSKFDCLVYEMLYIKDIKPSLNTQPTPFAPNCLREFISYAAGRVLIKTKILRFYLKQRSSTLNNLMGRVKTIREPCVFRARPSVPFQRVANGHIRFFTERDWSQECCHGNKMVGVILFLL